MNGIYNYILVKLGINSIPHYCYGDVVYVSSEWYIAKSAEWYPAKPIEAEHFERMLYYSTGCRYMEFVCYENGVRGEVKYEWDEELGMYRDKTEG